MATTTKSKTTAAAVYCRISDDRAGEGLGVRRQADDGRNYCAVRGWEVVDVYVDNDTSAYTGKSRPAYQRLLADLAAGELNAVVAWHPDRLHRSPTELESFIELVEATGAKVGTVRAGEYDLSTPTGRMSARIVGAVAKHESEHKADRIRRKHEELAAAGEGRGGGTRPFGFNADRLTINEAEAGLVREAARRVLAGETVRSVCADWNHRDISTVTGKRWHPHVLKSMLISARIAGLREHHGEVVAKAVWPAIIHEAQHRQLRALLTDPARRTNGRARRGYLLSGGLALCGLCGSSLVARPRDDKRRTYVCSSGPGFGGCGKIRVLADPLEDLVADAVILRLDGPELASALAARAGDEQEEAALSRVIATDEARLVELAEMWAAGDISRGEWVAARKAVEGRLEAGKKALSRHRHMTAVDDFVGRPGALRSAWEGLNLDRRRAVVAAVVDLVVVGPAVRGRNRFDPERVDVVWRA
ncbi:MAG: recombinase family protein [Actinomycetota bacterium]|nr:recombinase family protein [Actinomycetota bacterium]MDQ3679389.1 recombinase family protein [Actinomycetota bacterium]